MERVTLEEAQKRLAELLTRAVEGEIIVVEVGDQQQIQLVRLPIQYLRENDGITTYQGHGARSSGGDEGIYCPYAISEQERQRERARRPPREFGSMAGLISMRDDFDEPWELVPSRLVDKYPELREARGPSSALEDADPQREDFTDPQKKSQP